MWLDIEQKELEMGSIYTYIFRFRKKHVELYGIRSTTGKYKVYNPTGQFCVCFNGDIS